MFDTGKFLDATVSPDFSVCPAWKSIISQASWHVSRNKKRPQKTKKVRKMGYPRFIAFSVHVSTKHRDEEVNKVIKYWIILCLLNIKALDSDFKPRCMCSCRRINKIVFLSIKCALFVRNFILFARLEKVTQWKDMLTEMRDRHRKILVIKFNTNWCRSLLNPIGDYKN